MQNLTVVESKIREINHAYLHSLCHRRTLCPNRKYILCIQYWTFALRGNIFQRAYNLITRRIRRIPISLAMYVCGYTD